MIPQIENSEETIKMIQIQKHLLDNFGTTAYKDKVKQERSSLTKFT